MTILLTPPAPPPPASPTSVVVGQGLGRWLSAPVLVVAVSVVAFHRSLLSLLEGLRLDTPLSHLGLVPVMALGVAWLRRRCRDDLDIHDRQLDWIVGLPLIAAALAANLLLPAQLSTDYWTWRLDMLTLPLFVAGAAALILGVRALSRVVPAVLLLFLAWPWPYSFALERWLGSFTDLTVAALRAVMSVVPIATPVNATGGLFFVEHGADRVEMSVAAACAGANSLVGFLLVGTAMLAVVKGPGGRKVAWLATGALVVWSLNLVRIVAIFAAARSWGQEVAIEGFHPYVGLVAFAIGVALMVLMAPWFGLRLRLGMEPSERSQAADSRSPRSPRSVGGGPSRARLATAGVLLSGLVLAGTNVGLNRAEAVTSPFGNPRQAAFSLDDRVPAGWGLRRVTEYDWTKQFFGRDSTWTRYNYLSAGDGPLNSNLPVIADVVDTGSRANLVAYGVKECYRFHDYDIIDEESTSLGGGVVGKLLTFRPTANSVWTTLHWQWPVRTGDRTRYERVTLLVIDAESGYFVVPGDIGRAHPQLEVADLLRGADDARVPPRIDRTQTFLVAFGRQLVEGRL